MTVTPTNDPPAVSSEQGCTPQLFQCFPHVAYMLTKPGKQSYSHQTSMCRAHTIDFERRSYTDIRQTSVDDLHVFAYFDLFSSTWAQDKYKTYPGGLMLGCSESATNIVLAPKVK